MQVELLTLIATAMQTQLPPNQVEWNALLACTATTAVLATGHEFLQPAM
jgi:hypothetical protein